MTSFDEPGRVKREGILTRLLRFLGIGASAEDEQERARLAALNLNMAVYADLFANESEEILVLTSDFEAQAGTFRINANIGNGKKQFQGKTRRLLAYIDPKNVFIVSASAVNYRHEQKNLPKRYQSRAICASPSPAGKCP